MWRGGFGLGLWCLTDGFWVVFAELGGVVCFSVLGGFDYGGCLVVFMWFWVWV